MSKGSRPAMMMFVGLVVLTLGLRVTAAATDEMRQVSDWTNTLSDRPGEFTLRFDPPTDDGGPGEGWPRDQQLDKTFVLTDAEEPVTTGPDWVGLGRDTAFLVGYQLALAGILWALPSDISNWSEEEKGRGAKNWVNNVTKPEWDMDSWWINYIFHPYFGAAYYIRARERGLDEVSSFAYSALASALYEFGVEAFFEKPSIQDLIVTPIAGSLLAAFVFEPIRARIRLKHELAWYDHIGLVLTDPIGTLNGTFERLFGIKSNIRVDLQPPSLARPIDRSKHVRDRAIGLQLSVPWD
jgi:hypothetical protein